MAACACARHVGRERAGWVVVSLYEMISCVGTVDTDMDSPWIEIREGGTWMEGTCLGLYRMEVNAVSHDGWDGIRHST